MAEPRQEIVLAHSPAFRLGQVEVRPATREVIGPGSREILEPRVMEVLVALAGGGGEILSRDDLVQCCWGGRAVSDDAINRVISKLRRLGQDIGAGSFRIETITRVGYRLLADGPAGSAPGPSGAASDPIGLPRLSRRAMLGGAAAAAAGATAFAWFHFSDRPPTQAEQLYERGVDVMRSGTAEQIAESVGFLREAVALSPLYADGWGMLAIAYLAQASLEPPQAARLTEARARSAARRALELDRDNPHGRAAGAIAVHLYRNWAAAEVAIRAVLTDHPDHAHLRDRLSRLLAGVGRVRDAIEQIDAPSGPIALMPPVQLRLASMLWSADRLEESDRVIDRAMQLWPRHQGVWFTRFWLYAYNGRHAEALALASDLARRPTGIPEWNFAMIAASARALASRAPADIETAMQANGRAARIAVGFCENAIQLAAELGRVDEAFDFALAYYFGQGFSIGPARFSREQGIYAPHFSPRTDFLFLPSCSRLRADPRFRTLLERTGLSDYWRRTRTRPDLPIAS